MSKIMVIAGGDWQIPLIKKAKSMGHEIICSNLYEDSPAFSFADICEVADVLDRGRNLQIAEKYMPDAIISEQSDIAVPTVAYLNEKLGLNGIGSSIAGIFTNKHIMRVFCREHGFAIPDFAYCRTVEEAVCFLKKYKKVIMKPIDSQSSRGVYTIFSEQQLRDRFNESLGFSNSDKAVMIEEYINGDEFTVDGLCVDRIHYPLCVSIKEQYRQNPNLTRALFVSHHNPAYDYEELKRINKQLIEASQLPFGLTHAEYKFCKGKYYLIEAAVRGGGTNLAGKIVPMMSGIDNYGIYINSALGKTCNLDLSHSIKNDDSVFMGMRFLDFGEGKVKRILGTEIFRESEQIVDYQVNFKEGDILENPKYGRLRPGHFIFKETGMENVRDFMQYIEKAVRVEFEDK